MRKADVHSRRLAPVRIYRDELDHIASLAAPDGKVEFRSGGFVYDSLDELAAHLKEGRVQSLVIQPVSNADGDVAISISPRQVEVFSLSESSERANQLAIFLKQHARGAQPAWWRVLYGALARLVSIVVGVLAFTLSDAPPVGAALLAGFATIVSLSLLTAIRRPLGESAVYLHHRRQIGRSAQRDTYIVVAIVSGLIGLLIGLAL